MKPKHRGVIFDLDGTLVNTLGDIAVSMNRALELHRFPALPVAEFKDKVGWGIKRLAFLSLPAEARSEETAAVIAQEAAGFYAEAPFVHSRPYPGIPELVSILRQRKIMTAVLTNKPDRVAQLVIAGLFPSGSFDAVQGEMRDRPRKPDPACVWDLLVNMNLSPADVIVVGDSEVDMETALVSGCFPLGVSWGYRPVRTIEEAGARKIIDKPDELLELF